jgi:hypothetical protein
MFKELLEIIEMMAREADLKTLIKKRKIIIFLKILKFF